METKKEELNDATIEKDKNSAIDDQSTYYKDDNIELSPDGLIIKKYYLPFFSSKLIPINKIKNIQLKELSLLNGKLRVMGISFPLVYYNWDFGRIFKTHAIIIEEESNCLSIGITPDKPEECFKVLNNLWTHSKGKEKDVPIFDKQEDSDVLSEGKEKIN